MQELSDAELIRLCLLGKYQHYEALVERYEVLVRTLVERLIGDIDESEVIAHRAFVTAYDRLGEFSFARERFAIWLLSIAAEHARAHLRSKGRASPLSQRLSRHWQRKLAGSQRVKDAADHVVPS